jgi:hypothetical protein
MIFITLFLIVIGIALIIGDNRRDSKYKEHTNKAYEYRRMQYLKSLKDDEK